MVVVRHKDFHGYRNAAERSASNALSADSISARIEILRIVLISGIVLIHIPCDAATSPYAGHGAFSWLQIYLRDVLFRAGVPCLSVISGYLLFRRSAEIDYAKLIQLKLRTLAIPFLIWNISLFLLIFVAEYFGFGKGYFPAIADLSRYAAADQMFAITSYPINLPLYFLRDLMVCFLLAPLIGVLIRRLPVPTLIILLLAAVFSVQSYIVLRSDILFTFALGAGLALHRIDPKGLDRWAPWLIGAFLILSLAMVVLLARNGEQHNFWLSVAGKLLNGLGLIAFWTAASLIENRRIGHRIACAGRYSFWIFCSHYPLMPGLWVVWTKIGGTAPNYPFFFVLASLLTLASLIAAYHVLSVVLPGVLATLTGDRARDRRARAPQPSPGIA